MGVSLRENVRNMFVTISLKPNAGESVYLLSGSGVEGRILYTIQFFNTNKYFNYGYTEGLSPRQTSVIFIRLSP